MKTSISTSTASRIEVYGFDLTEEIVGHLDLGAFVFLAARGRRPDEAESRMFNAVLVGMAEHGLTPSALAARLTFIGAPEASQAAIAAGLAGAGSVFLGVMDDTGEMLADGVARIAEGGTEQETAGRIVEQAAGRPLPGFGHTLHKPTDPRTSRFFALAEELGFSGPHTALMKAIQRRLSTERGGEITLNGAGAAGAVLADMGFDWRITRACIVAARAAGLVGHVAEEMRSGMKGSVAFATTRSANRHTEYVRGGAPA